MREDRFFHNQHYIEYVRLLFDLHRAISEGWDETNEGEALRERMEGPGSYLSSDETASLNGISADFYSLTDASPTGVSPMTGAALTGLELLFQPQESKEHHRSLDLLRKHAESIPAASLAYLRGRIWMEAGEYRIATAFLERGSELDPENANFRYLAFHSLWKADPLAAFHKAQSILANAERHSPRLVLKAVDILLQQMRAEARDQTHGELQSFVPIIQNSIFRLETSGEAERDPDLLRQAFSQIDFCQH